MIFDFWQAGYPGIRSISDNLAAIRAHGYEPAGHFVLPAEAWGDAYYAPILEKLPRLREGYKDDPEALGVLEEHVVEIEFFKTYAAYYGYVFFVMRRTG